MKNKNYHIIIIVCISLATWISSCDKGFTELNTNKVDPTSLNPAFVMNQSIIDAKITAPTRTQAWLCYDFPIVQQMLTPFGSSLSGGNYNQLNPANSNILWDDYYSDVVKQIVDVVAKTNQDPKQVNLYNTARIWKAYVFMILTDTYGDVPYTEAGVGFLNKATSPKYDSQADIYKDILNELDEASSALDISIPASPSDILYSGNIIQWRRLGYSLMLRAAMRLTKVDPTLAQTYVAKAVAGGLMQSNLDNAVLRHSSLYVNHLGEEVSGREKANFYLGEPFVNYLKSNKDPRLPIFSIRYVGALNGTQQTPSIASSDPDKQIGMPFGYNDVSISSTFQQNGVVSLWDYSQGNITTVLQVSSPEFFVTYSQTKLLLAEAVVRGWASGDASVIFEDGIRANMRQMAAYGTTATIDENAIQTYIQAHPLDISKALEQINTQYWVSSFLDGPEAFANFRRSGYPLLTPNPYPGSEIPGGFIHRLVYPDDEYVVNKPNAEEANGRQGPDKLDTRVWWDK